MRVVAVLVLLLGLLVWLATAWGPTETSGARTSADTTSARFEPPWRRTAQGWEQATWQRTTPRYEPALHPGLVAAFEILVVLMLLAHAAPPTKASLPTRRIARHSAARA